MVARALVALLLVCSVAYADGDKPWAEGVPQAQQDAAFKAYDAANALFAQGEYKKALEKYDEAVKLWDHPGIRYNRAVCLINLDRPVEAYQDLEAALKFGEEPLGKDLYNEGINYQKLLAKQVAEVEISAKDTGAHISLDGKPIALTSGHTMEMVAINAPHEITASKPGYQTFRKPLDHLPAGQRTVIEVRLEPLEHGRWKPWAVIAGGAIVSGIGIGFFSVASGQISKYETAIANNCQMGCLNDDALGDAQHLPDRARRNEIVAYSLMIAGGATIGAGVVLVVRGRGHATHVAPAVGKDSMGVSFSGSW